MSAPALGAQTIWTTGVEGSYGTAGTLDRSYELLPSEGVKRKNKTITRAGMRGGDFASYPGTRRIVIGHDAAGPVVLEVLPTGAGRLLRQIMGGTPVITQVGATIAFEHVYPLGPLTGKSFTAQKVLREPDGTVIQAITQKGCKVTAAEFAINLDQTLRLSLDVDARQEVTDVAAAAAAYASATIDPFHFGQGAITVDGVAVAAVSIASAKIERPSIKVDGFYLGTNGVKDEPREEGRPKFSGSLTTEVLDATLYDLFCEDGGGTLVLEFVGDLIVGASSSTLTIEIPDIHITDGTPAVSTEGTLPGVHPWEADAGGATITYLTTDTAS